MNSRSGDQRAGGPDVSGAAGRADPGAPAVTVVTVLYQSSAEFGAFLAGVPREIPGGAVQVIAVDNGSADSGASAAVAAAREGVTFLALTDNWGYGGAVNRGVAHAREAGLLGPAIFIANPDLVCEPGALAALADTLRNAPADLAAIGPRVLNRDGTVYPSARRFPTLGVGIGHALLARIPNPWSRQYRGSAHDTSLARDVDWLSGACLLVRTPWFDRVGGFDEGYFMYFEDVDLGRRLQRAGGRCRYEPAATVVHTGGVSTSRAAAAMIRAHHVSAARYIASEYPGFWGAPIRAVVRAGLRVRCWWQVRSASRMGAQ